MYRVSGPSPRAGRYFLAEGFRALLPPVPVLVALPFGFSLGVGFAWAARRELRRVTSREASRGLAVAILFAVCVFAPVAAYFLAFEPDWCLAYLVDTGRA